MSTTSSDRAAQLQQLRDQPLPSDDAEFRGHVNPGPGQPNVTLHGLAGTKLGDLPHFMRNSPEGFSWGYSGSGPTELARCLLITVVGPKAICETCAGTTRTIYNPSDERFESFDPARHDRDRSFGCPDCGSEGFTIAPALFQRFKAEYVATWPQFEDWSITVGEIRTWLAAQPPE